MKHGNVVASASPCLWMLVLRAASVYYLAALLDRTRRACARGMRIATVALDLGRCAIRQFPCAAVPSAMNVERIAFGDELRNARQELQQALGRGHW